MAGHEGRVDERQVALDHVEVRAADAADGDAHQHLPRARRRARHVFEGERRTRDRRLGMEN
jgi:hypothetical protein